MRTNASVNDRDLPRLHDTDKPQLIAGRREAAGKVPQATLAAHEAIGDRDLSEPRILDG
jgi:hypothetical protein